MHGNLAVCISDWLGASQVLDAQNKTILLFC